MSSAIEVLKTKNINDEEIKTKEINFNTGFREIINICDYNINYLLKESPKKAIWKFNHMRSEIRYWEGIKELANQRKEALLALEKRENYVIDFIRLEVLPKTKKEQFRVFFKDGTEQVFEQERVGEQK